MHACTYNVIVIIMKVLIFLLPLSFIVTSVVSVFPLTAPQVEAGMLSVNLNVSSHSVMLSIMMLILNDFPISPAATLTVVKSLV